MELGVKGATVSKAHDQREPHRSGPPPFWYSGVTEVKFKPMMTLWL